MLPYSMQAPNGGFHIIIVDVLTTIKMSTFVIVWDKYCIFKNDCWEDPFKVFFHEVSTTKFEHNTKTLLFTYKYT